jgi:hypothetical protein
MLAYSDGLSFVRMDRNLTVLIISKKDFLEVCVGNESAVVGWNGHDPANKQNWKDVVHGSLLTLLLDYSCITITLPFQ